VPIAVVYQSGSHYSTIQRSSHTCRPDKINLPSPTALLFHRLDQSDRRPGARCPRCQRPLLLVADSSASARSSTDLS